MLYLFNYIRVLLKIDKTVGEGAYAKVKLADVLPSKMARNADLADNADNDGNLKVFTCN